MAATSATPPVNFAARGLAAHKQFQVLPTARSTPEKTTALAASASWDRNTRLTNFSDSSRPRPSISRFRRRTLGLGAGASSHLGSSGVEGTSVVGEPTNSV